MRHGRRCKKARALSDARAVGSTVEVAASHPGLLARADASRGRSAKALVIFAITASFALLTYAAYAQAAGLRSQPHSPQAMHGKR